MITGSPLPCCTQLPRQRSSTPMFPAPRLAPARHVHQADRRLRRALEAYSTILTHHERLVLYVD